MRVRTRASPDAPAESLKSFVAVIAVLSLNPTIRPRQ